MIGFSQIKRGCWAYEYAPDYRLLGVEVEGEDITFDFTHDDNGQREMKIHNDKLVEA